GRCKSFVPNEAPRKASSAAINDPILQAGDIASSHWGLVVLSEASRSTSRAIFAPQRRAQRTGPFQALPARLQARRWHSAGHLTAHHPCPPPSFSNAREARRYYFCVTFLRKIEPKGRSETPISACLGSAFVAPQHRSVQFFANGAQGLVTGGTQRKIAN